MDINICIICEKTIHDGCDVSSLTDKGVEGIQQTCKARKIAEFHLTVGQKIHKRCRAQFINLKAPFKKQHSEVSCSPVKSSNEEAFNFESNCFFCATEISQIYKRKKKGEWFETRTVNIKTSVLEKCEERNDDWAKSVKLRLLNLNDLPAAGACYHKQCMVNFRNGKSIPQNYIASTKAPIGRPEDEVRNEAFLKTAKFMKENDEEQLTICNLTEKMKEFLPVDYEPYSVKFMKEKLVNHFQDEIFIGTVAGTKDIVTFKSTAAFVLREYHKSKKLETISEEKMKLINTAGKLIRNDIKEIPIDSENYPSTENIGNLQYNLNYVPETLRLLLSILVTGKKNKDRKISAIGQAIMQAVRPRGLVTPLQLGLGVQLHENTSSKFIVESVSHMGFCSSYSEVQKFERSAAVQRGTSMPDSPHPSPDRFIQYSADNIDHNSITLDGNGTFHGMGIIASVVPAGKFCTAIKKRNVCLEELKEVGKIPIKYYPSQASGMRLLEYKHLKEIRYFDPTGNLDSLLNISHLLQQKVPAWQGVCQLLHKGVHPGVSSIVFLPMIDMSPTDETCILSTMLFVADQAQRYNQIPVLTFDQPLFQKAQGIVLNEPETSVLKKIVLRLGGLHTIMSFLGCAGFLMSGTGLSEILEVIYAGNTVKHMLTGKAVARAIRGHLIVSDALNTVISKKALGTVEENGELKEAQILLKNLLDENISLVEADFECIKKLTKKIKETKTKLETSRTAKLWLQYLKMVDIMKRFIKAERTGNWQMHLQIVKEMMPFFAACGHNSYASSAHIYLDNMVELETTAPEVHSAFLNGLHIVRRSDRFWGGLSTDLVIEQVLMKSIKGFGGMTHGKGMTEQQQLLWVMSRPICAHVNHAMGEFTGINQVVNDQHVSMSNSRIARDNEDYEKIHSFVDNMYIFEESKDLRNVVTGVIYESDVNPELAEEVGNAIVEEMTGKTVSTFSFKKNKQVKPIKSVQFVKTKDDTFIIDPTVLFQRLLLYAQSNALDLSQVFCYELCTYPASLFDKCGLLRESGKSQLAKFIHEKVGHNTSELPNLHFIVDGGWLLHQIPWSQGQTYEEIFQTYQTYLLRKYGKATVVFDGYGDKLSTKSEAHQRRSRFEGPQVNFSPSMKLCIKKELFLSNISNKETFINHLAMKLKAAGCLIEQAKGDADLMIVTECISSARLQPTAIIGDDTDLLILLIHYFDPECHDVFLLPQPKRSSKFENVYDIKKIKHKLGEDVCSHILFTHAMLGCDTTSKPFGLGKCDIIKLMLKSDCLKQQAAVFKSVGKTQDEIKLAGEETMVALYRGRPGETLNELRVRTFTTKAAKSVTHVKPESLPPTEDTNMFHSFRVYLQIQQWLGVDIDPLKWGWELNKDKLKPTKMTKAPAPDNLLKFTRCGCTTSQCSTQQCICRRQGMQCTSACSDCRGVSCRNCAGLSLDVDDDL